MVGTVFVFSRQPIKFLHRRRSDRISYLPRVDRLSDGTPIGKRGSLYYLLDDDYSTISPGFHDIRCVRCGVYIGKLGSQKSVFVSPAVIVSIARLMYRFIQVLLEITTLVDNERLPLP